MFLRSNELTAKMHALCRAKDANNLDKFVDSLPEGAWIGWMDGDRPRDNTPFYRGGLRVMFKPQHDEYGNLADWTGWETDYVWIRKGISLEQIPR